MTKVTLSKLPDRLTKADEGDGEMTFTKAQLDALLAKGEGDPEIRELVRECLADPGSPSPAVGKVVERVEVRKEGSMGAGAEALRKAYLDGAREARAEGDVAKAERLTKRASSLAAPAAGSSGSVEIRKAVAAQPSAAELRERVAKLERDIATTKANAAVDEVMRLCRSPRPEDLAKAGELLRAPATDAAYRARIVGESYEHPVAKVEPDPRATIRKLVRDDDMDGLGELLRSEPAADGWYREMVARGELAEETVAAAEVRKRQQARTPGEVSEAEKAPFRPKIKALLAKHTAEASRELQELLRDVRAQAAWIDMSLAGETKAAA